MLHGVKLEKTMELCVRRTVHKSLSRFQTETAGLRCWNGTGGGGGAAVDVMLLCWVLWCLRVLKYVTGIFFARSPKNGAWSVSQCCSCSCNIWIKLALVRNICFAGEISIGICMNHVWRCPWEKIAPAVPDLYIQSVHGHDSTYFLGMYVSHHFLGYCLHYYYGLEWNDMAFYL